MTGNNSFRSCQCITWFCTSCLPLCWQGNSDEDEKVVVLNNYDWLKEISLLDFLKDVGKYARVGTMMAKESVKARLNSEDGMSYTEFTYQLLQGYDFVHLFRVQPFCYVLSNMI